MKGASHPNLGQSGSSDDEVIFFHQDEVNQKSNLTDVNCIDDVAEVTAEYIPVTQCRSISLSYIIYSCYNDYFSESGMV